ncbi:hypothetical protein GCM10009682_08940 [Luedemannella flava]|uniref:Thioredoxin domain-containing protein n=1 Tax=Luedemannella flava TaxID=349316 RepID=A0ABP4XN57_9ACTN
MRRAVALLLSALALAACGSTGGKADPGGPSPFAACPGAATAPAGSPASDLALAPDVTLDCFAGGPRVRLRALGRPAVVNLYASWCAPCRQELPALQRLADSGAVLVLGVVTGDTRAAAASLATDVGVTFPAVFDADRTLLARLGRGGLPVTMFLDAGGHVVYLHDKAALTDQTLARLVRDKLHVDLP